MAQHSIPCSPECKIVGLILLYHCLIHALTATADVPAVDTLHLPVETLENPFVTPANIHTIEAFMNRVGYQGLVDKDFMNNMFQKKEDIQYPRFIKLIDDVLLVSVYTTGNVLVRGMLISDAFLTAKIRETGDFKEYETMFMKVDVLMNQPQPVVSTQGTNRNTPRATRTPTVSASPQELKKRKQNAEESNDRERDEMAEATNLSLTLNKTALDAEAKENIVKVQEMLQQEEIDKLVDGVEDEESYASAFADSVINNDDDDTGSKLEPESHKEHPEHVSDDDAMKKKDEEVEKEKEVVEIVKETNVDDTSVKKNNEVVTKKEVVDMLGSQQIKKEQKQTPIPSPIRYPKNDLSSDKTISKELADTVTPTTTTSSKTPLTKTCHKKSFTLKIRRLPGSIAGICRRRGLI
ncbi:hypothetical protein Tco_0804519 [Tanacetum coccineum]|uniref:Uncharacterized protein n=1 Tax=Tanacetum coccineum TaxID=301880 RepID=A0ABQ5A7I6_9ASTR